jgi:hypothetical protein
VLVLLSHTTVWPCKTNNLTPVLFQRHRRVGSSREVYGIFWGFFEFKISFPTNFLRPEVRLWFLEVIIRGVPSSRRRRKNGCLLSP